MPNYEVTLIAFTTVAVENAENEEEAMQIAQDEVSSDFTIDEFKVSECSEHTWETVKNCSDHKSLDS